MFKKLHLLLCSIACLCLLPAAAQAADCTPSIPCARNEQVIALLQDYQQEIEAELEAARMAEIYEARRAYIPLVNAEHPLEDGYDVNLVSVDGGRGKMDEQAAEDLERMLDAGRAEGLSLQLISTYRTYAYQQSLFQRQLSKRRAQGYTGQDAIAAASRIVAYPGTSEHHTGLAADIVSSSYLSDNDYLTRAYKYTDEAEWLEAHCAEYGFILRYPDGKSDYTGIIYEPWHYRWVGTDLAQAITASGLCLEEYLGYDAEY